MKKVRVVVSGRVQGVWFRASTREVALELGVRGYVKNLPDGNVEFVAEGEDAQVEKLLEWARKGPPYARVDEVRVEDLEYRGEFKDFSVRH
jgi:acylphosphatase